MSVFSAYWYRVENLKPKLRPHARIQRHHYRGERWHVIEDSASGRYHRFAPNVYYLIAQMDGTKTISEIWNASMTYLGDDSPCQNELIMLLSQLHTADLLQSDVTPDTAEVFERFSKAKSQKWMSRIMNPAFARVPIWDPDNWLRRWVHVAEFFFKPWALVVWFLFMMFAGLQMATHWASLTAPSLASMMQPNNILILCITYPLVKIVHELGHAFATRVYGGEVHDVGISFLIFVPMPYVDASASSGFGSKWRRIVVAGAGVMIELFISAVALLIWIELAPSFVRTVLFNVMIIGGVSTLFFNGNPLMKFDGYYILSDLLEIPNLTARANQYLRYLLEHYVMGLPERRRMVLAPGELGWLVSYGVSAWLYKITITFGIALYLASQFFFIGVMLAAWGLILQVGIPALRGLANLRSDPRVKASIVRVYSTLGGLVAAFLTVVFIVPLPAWSTYEGVVWVPERAQLRAGIDGFVTRIAAANDQEIEPGDLVIETRDPLLDARIRVLKASLDEARAEYGQTRQTNLAEARIQHEEVARLRSEVESATSERDRGFIRAGGSGRFVLVERDLEGRFAHRGDVLGYVAEHWQPTVRMIVPEHEINLLTSQLEKVEVRLAEAPERLIDAAVDTIVPTVSNQLPSMALGAGGGGAVAVDSRDPDGLTAAESFFLVDLELPKDTHASGFGGRVFIRLDYHSEPVFWRAKRYVRRLFMGELGV